MCCLLRKRVKSGSVKRKRDAPLLATAPHRRVGSGIGRRRGGGGYTFAGGAHGERGGGALPAE